MFATLYPPGNATFTTQPPIDEVRAALKRAPRRASRCTSPAATRSTSRRARDQGPGVLTETLLGGAGALVVLILVFGTLAAVAMPIVVAITSILTTFLCVFALTYITNVSIIVQFLVALVGLGVAIDYALLVVFRFREELTLHDTTEEALVETMTHAGRSVIVSGSTVAIGLLSMLVIPLPFIRSIGLGGMLIPAVSVLSSITLLPAMLAILGPRINRLRVMPRKFVEPHPPEAGVWWRWSRLVMRRSGLVFAAGHRDRRARAHPRVPDQPERRGARRTSPRRAMRSPGRDAIDGGGAARRASCCRTRSSSSTARRRRCSQTRRGEDRGRQGHRGGDGAEGVAHGRHRARGGVRQRGRELARREEDDLPAAARRAAEARELRRRTARRLTLAGVGPEGRDFIKAVYGKFPYVVLFVLILTYLLLTRAFRSIVLPLKAVLLNLVSLGAAYGIVVFIFQQGHGSDAIWGVQATDSIISWIPLMIFAFLYGISMDYEVFMLTRIREEYDETGDTPSRSRARPRTHGQARHERGRGADARVLLALDRARAPTSSSSRSASPPGVIFDATVIRALLVPATMQLLGRWNWIFPQRVARLLRVAPRDVTPFARRHLAEARGRARARRVQVARRAARCSTRAGPDVVVTASTGNHGAATAWAAKRGGHPRDRLRPARARARQRSR